MFFTYVFRELRRRHRQALLTALGLAVGVALVVTVTAYADGVSKAQDTVLQSLYGVGTDITVSQQAKMDQGGSQRFSMKPPDESKQGEEFDRSAVMTAPGQQSMSTKRLTQIAALDGVSNVTGSITMQVMNVQGEFAQVQGGEQQRPAERPAAVRRLELLAAAGPGADGAHRRLVAQRVGRRHHRPRPRAPELRADHVRALADRRRRGRQGRARHPGVRQAELAQGGRHQEDRRQEVRDRRHRRPAQRQHARPTCTSPSPGRRSSATTRARSTRSTSRPTTPPSSPRSRARSRTSCPRRP